MAKKKKADKRETSPTKGSRPPGIAIPIGRAPDITVKSNPWLDAPSEGAVTQKVEGVLDDRTSSGLSEGGGTELANSESKGTKSVKAEIPETQDKVEDKNIENRKLETNQPEDKQPDEDKKAESTRPAAETLKAKNPDDKTAEGETPTAKEPGSNETEVKMPAIESLKHARTRDVTLKEPSKTTLPLQMKIPPCPAVLFGENEF